MAVQGRLTDGVAFELAPFEGSTVREVVEKLTTDSLTGSAVILDSAVLTTKDGGEIRWGDVAALADTDDDA